MPLTSQMHSDPRSSLTGLHCLQMLRYCFMVFEVDFLMQSSRVCLKRMPVLKSVGFCTHQFKVMSFVLLFAFSFFVLKYVTTLRVFHLTFDCYFPTYIVMVGCFSRTCVLGIYSPILVLP